MSILVASPRSLERISFATTIRFRFQRCIRPLVAALILMFAGNAHAVIDVGLAIENNLDSNGNITVVEGSKVRVAYTVIDDTDNDLHKKDKIQLLRVSDDSVVDAVVRGKKKSGSVWLKVKNSVNEQLYVRYIRKTGTEIARISHPSDPGFIALLSIAKANLEDLTVSLHAQKTAPVSVHAAAFNDEFFGDLDCDYRLNSVHYGYYLNTGSNCDAMASISLPNGAVLSSISCAVYDSAATGGEEITAVRMRRVGLLANSQVTVFATGPSDDSGFQTISDNTPTGGTEVVDNAAYAYILWADFGSGPAAGSSVRLYGCSVQFEG
jgi:hypothetical protein